MKKKLIERDLKMGNQEKMFDQKLLQQAIESAKCRIYRLKTNQGDTLAHQMKAENQIELQKITVAALERQVAKKPNIWGDGYSDGQLVYDMYNCPNCEKSYEIEFDDYNYCPNCGQKLLWEN